MQMLGMAQYATAKAVVPSDTVQISCRGIYVGGAGNVTVTPGPANSPGTPVTFTAPPVGFIIPIELNQGFINSTGTTATLLVALA
jgi:hypothetical protein